MSMEKGGNKPRNYISTYCTVSNDDDCYDDLVVNLKKIYIYYYIVVLRAASHITFHLLRDLIAFV